MKKTFALLFYFLSPFLLNAQTVFQDAIGGAGDDYAHGVIQASDGSYMVVGTTKSFGAGNDDIYLMKITSSGYLSWAKTYGAAGDDQGFSVQQTTDGGFIILGNTSSFLNYRDIYLVKTTSSGSLSWAKTFGSGDQEAAYSIQQTSDGGYVIAGTTMSYWYGGMGMGAGPNY